MIYQTELDIVEPGLRARVLFSYVPGRPGCYHLAPEDCYPDEPAETEILEVQVMLANRDGGWLVGPDISDFMSKKALEDVAERVKSAGPEAWEHVA